jgi:hypothetical protein
VSPWDYVAGVRACLENMAAGDFSNRLWGREPKNALEHLEWKELAKKRLAEWIEEHGLEPTHD